MFKLVMVNCICKVVPHFKSLRWLFAFHAQLVMPFYFISSLYKATLLAPAIMSFMPFYRPLNHFLFFSILYNFTSSVVIISSLFNLSSDSSFLLFFSECPIFSLSSIIHTKTSQAILSYIFELIRLLRL